MRLKPGDDLVHRGRVGAESDDLARLHARNTYDEEDWAEMHVVREDHLLEAPRHPEAPATGRDA